MPCRRMIITDNATKIKKPSTTKRVKNINYKLKLEKC